MANPALLRGVDIWMLLSAVICALFGFAALSGFALVSEPPNWSLLTRQSVALVLGIVCAVAAARVDVRVLAGWSLWMWGAGFLALVAVLIFGQVHRGTVGWFDLGFVSVQPVEAVKMILIFVLAHVLSRERKRESRNTSLILALVLASIFIGLVLQQPDYGSAGVLLAITVLLLFLAGLRWKTVLVVGGLFLAMSVWLWTSVLADFQRERILTFLDAERDPLGRGYNVVQAKIAIGSGQWIGKGLGFGSQSRLHFLPEAQTDFLFAAIGEEFGFLGLSVLLSAYGVLLWRLWRLVRVAGDPLSAYVAGGIAMLFWVQGTITVGMNMGVMPVTGLPLPFVSYGGSSLLASCVLLGVAQGIAMRSKTSAHLSMQQEYIPFYVR